MRLEINSLKDLENEIVERERQNARLCKEVISKERGVCEVGSLLQNNKIWEEWLAIQEEEDRNLAIKKIMLYNDQIDDIVFQLDKLFNILNNVINKRKRSQMHHNVLNMLLLRDIVNIDCDEYGTVTIDKKMEDGGTKSYSFNIHDLHQDLKGYNKNNKDNKKADMEYFLVDLMYVEINDEKDIVCPFCNDHVLFLDSKHRKMGPDYEQLYCSNCNAYTIWYEKPIKGKEVIWIKSTKKEEVDMS